MAATIKYFQCPYCIPFEGGHGKKVPKNIGLYRVKTFETNDAVLVCECQRCKKVFRIRMMGIPLLWDDLSIQEKA